jgi:HJR/Mrr/RecB family endonuclease
MSDFDQAEILHRLEMVEAETDAQRAEIRLLDVLVPVLEAERYAVEHTGGLGDQGIDFLATSSEQERGLPSRVGIQYKHRQRPLGTSEVQQVIGVSITNDLDRMLLLSRSGFSVAARRILERALPTAVELVDLDSLRRWIMRLGTQEPESMRSAALVAIAELSAALARIIARNPTELEHIEWRDLERLIAAIFAKLGFQTTLTPPAKDGGRDVILQFAVSGQGRSFIVEAKHWRSRQRVGKGHITEFIKVVASEQWNGGLVLATYGYTGTAFEAITEVERQSLYAGDESKIVALCRTFVRAEAGLFTAPADLTEVITSDTLEWR